LAISITWENCLSRIDPVFGERFGAGGVVGQKLVADIVEIADQRHVDAAQHQPIADERNRGGGFVAVDGDAHDLRSGPRQGGHLGHRRLDISGIGIGHRLDDNGRPAPHGHPADIDPDRSVALRWTCHHGNPFLAGNT
jgi:hypothetical protein